MRKFFGALAAVIMLACRGTAFAASCDVAVLMYHNVTTDESRLSDWCVSASQLEEDINLFTSNGYTMLTASELAGGITEELDGEKILLLTFDDGYEEWYTEVYPILLRTNAKATMFVIGSYVNRYGYLSENQIREMSDCPLIEIGSHTRYLHSMPLETLQSIYASDNAGDALEDIRRGNEYLSKITGKSVTAFAWPYGYYTDDMDWRVKNELGCLITFGTQFGAQVYEDGASCALCRINRESSKSSEEIYSSAESELEKARQNNK